MAALIWLRATDRPSESGAGKRDGGDFEKSARRRKRRRETNKSQRERRLDLWIMTMIRLMILGVVYRSSAAVIGNRNGKSIAITKRAMLSVCLFAVVVEFARLTND